MNTKRLFKALLNSILLVALFCSVVAAKSRDVQISAAALASDSATGEVMEGDKNGYGSQAGDSASGFAVLPVIATDASGACQLENVHLDEILLLALQRNRSVVSSAQQIQAADARVIQARSILGARLAGNFSHTRVDEVAINAAGNKLGKEDTQVAYFEVTQPVFLSGKDRYSINSARLGRKSAGAGHTLTRQNILLDTTLRWLAWLFAGEAEEVSRKDLELAEAHHALVSARYEQKQVSQFEVLRAEVRLAKSRSDLCKSINSRQQACLDLLNVLDLPVNTRISTADRLEMPDLRIDLDKDMVEAIDLREDLNLRRLDVQLARQAVSAARSENQPVVSVFGQSGFQDPSSKSLTYDRKSYWKAGVVANFTLSDGGMRKGKVREANARLAMADNSLGEAMESASIEIKQSYLNMETAKEVVGAQREALKQAEEALRLAESDTKTDFFTR